MASTIAQSDTYTFTDHSGIPASASPTANPYDALLTHCANSPALIAQVYETHRRTILAQSLAAFTSPAFPGPTPDPILSRLLAHDTAFADPRHNLAFWARPPGPVLQLVMEVQARLATVLPRMWMAPPENVHMTILEIIPGQMAEGLAPYVRGIEGAAKQIAGMPAEGARRCRLVRPRVMVDRRAAAVNWVPGAEGTGSTYHHLRRDMYEATRAHVQVQSRYVVPSSHLTIGRFVEGGGADVLAEDGTVKTEKVRELVEVVGEINAWLEGWEGEWWVGQERGTELRKGQSWYGGGESVVVGEHY